MKVFVSLFISLIAYAGSIANGYAQLVAPSEDSVLLAQETENFHFQTAAQRWVAGFNFGMGLGFRNENLTFNNSTVLLDISVNPKVGYFLKKRWVAGISYDYYASINSYGEANDYAIFSHIGALYTRYYLPVGIFAELQAGGGGGHDRFRNGQEDVMKAPFKSWKYVTGIGIGNFWGERIQYELMLRYSEARHRYTRQPSDFILRRVNIVAGVTIALGK